MIFYSEVKFTGQSKICYGHLLDISAQLSSSPYVLRMKFSQEYLPQIVMFLVFMLSSDLCFKLQLWHFLNWAQIILDCGHNLLYWMYNYFLKAYFLDTIISHCETCPLVKHCFLLIEIIIVAFLVCRCNNLFQLIRCPCNEHRPWGPPTVNK